jgi:hypothetical protein
VRPVTDTFLATVSGSHQAVFRARLVSYGQTGTNPGRLNSDLTPKDEINILDGNVIFDTKADVNATVELYTDYAWPTSTDDMIAPYGHEIFVERGITYGDGTREWVSLGYFRIDSIEQEVRTGRLRVTGSDRMVRARDERPQQPVVFPAGSSVGGMIDFVIGNAVPLLVSVYDFNAYSTLTTTDHILDDDRLKFCRELLTSYGKIMYFDYAGRLQVKSSPSYSGASPVYTLSSGRDGVLVSLTQSLSRDGVYNGVIARGEPIGDLPPVEGRAYDENPDSPTYIFGPFGQVVRFFSSPFLNSQAQCVDAARSILESSTGLPHVVEMGAVPNPALEGWDVVEVRYSDRVAPEIHVLDSIYYPLSVTDPMVMTSRKQFLG